MRSPLGNEEIDELNTTQAVVIVGRKEKSG